MLVIDDDAELAETVATGLGRPAWPRKCCGPAPAHHLGATFARKDTARVYYHAMRLFRRRASKRPDKAEVQLVQEPTSAAKAGAETARQHRAAEARPDPDQPGWGRTIGQAISKPREDSANQE